MTEVELTDLVKRTLAEVAPDADLDKLQDDDDLRDTLDLDSMDHLNFVVGLAEAMGIDIPERDYTKLHTIRGAVRYLADRQ